jgi:hypothetical protein
MNQLLEKKKIGANFLDIKLKKMMWQEGQNFCYPELNFQINQ